ncbi:MAG: hypothetical protein Kow0092_07940 [Deferrisomatales bacterium]
MADPFDDYARAVKPLVDAATAAELSRILDGLPLAHRDRVEAALDGGKKVRGVLLCLLCEALGGGVGDALPRAAAVELVQAASLLHDDVVDGDAQRRGHPATWVLEGTRRAVLVGDAIFAWAIHRMSVLGREDGLIVAEAIARIAQGACRELLGGPEPGAAPRLGQVPPGLYLRIIRLKTGVLFAAACRLGARAAGGDGCLDRAAGRYGMALGEAYQIADDRMDVERWLAGARPNPAQATAFGPALAHFARGEPLGELPAQGPWPRELLETAARAMETALHRRLGRARRLAAALPGRGPGAERLRRAPEALVGQLLRRG